MILALLLSLTVYAQDYANDYAADDAHKHDGTHVDGQGDCGGNYMFPGDIAPLGSHSFMILGQDGPNHILAEHRSGTPPHNYQYLFRVRLDADEMTFYKKLLAESKILPSMTTIYFDDKTGKQLDRTFFCNNELDEIFGSKKKKGDKFEKLFPIRASLLKDCDHERSFEIEKSIYPGHHFTLDRNDFELVMNRYLPSYLTQEAFRQSLRHTVVPMAEVHNSYLAGDGKPDDTDSCPHDFYLKKTPVGKSIHSFVLLSEVDDSSVLAMHFYDQAPHNFQASLKLKLTPAEMATYRQAKKGAKTPPLLQTETRFCMADIRKDIKAGKLNLKGAIYREPGLSEYRRGQLVGPVNVPAKNISVLVNRNLMSLMNPVAVAEDVLGKQQPPAPGFVDIAQVNKNIKVDMRYATNLNFLGRRVNGYEDNKCYLTREAATALDKVQRAVEKQGYALLVLDCYRPQRAVDEFIKWVSDPKDTKMREMYYQEEPKDQLIKRGYIDSKSGHSRGSTLDLTLVKKDIRSYSYKEMVADCRLAKNIESTGQLNMGTTYDCFSKLSTTEYPQVPESARKNRLILRDAMEAAGFRNYPKEWWHYTLREEPFKDRYFDFPVR